MLRGGVHPWCENSHWFHHKIFFFSSSLDRCCLGTRPTVCFLISPTPPPLSPLLLQSFALIHCSLVEFLFSRLDNIKITNCQMLHTMPVLSHPSPPWNCSVFKKERHRKNTIQKLSPSSTLLLCFLALCVRCTCSIEGPEADPLIKVLAPSLIFERLCTVVTSNSAVLEMNQILGWEKPITSKRIGLDQNHICVARVW